MKPTFLIKYAPLLLIFAYTAFCIPWKKSTIVMELRSRKLLKNLEKNVKNWAFKVSDKEWHCTFLLPESNELDASIDTVWIRFSKNEFTITSASTEKEAKVLWDTGFIEYLSNKTWTPLHKGLKRDDSFVIPLSLPDYQVPRRKNSIFLCLLSTTLRETPDGGKASIY